MADPGTSLEKLINKGHAADKACVLGHTTCAHVEVLLKYYEDVTK